MSSSQTTHGHEGRREDFEALTLKILEFVNSETWSASHECLKQYPELLCDAADQLLEELARQQDDEDARDVVEEHRGLLIRCRTIGIASAFAELEERLRASEASESTSDDTIVHDLHEAVAHDDWQGCAQKSREALSLFSRHEDPTRWSALQYIQGACLLNDQDGDRAENLENALVAFEKALEVRRREHEPMEWAITMQYLGKVYLSRLRGTAEENIERAVTAFQKVLGVWTRETSPRKWAETSTDLANAYQERWYGDRSANIEEAIRLYQQALQIATLEETPIGWGTAQVNLGIAYLQRREGVHSENLERALEACSQALRALTRESAPLEWAKTMSNLGLVYHELRRGNVATNLERALECYESALEAIPREHMPRMHAGVMINQGTAFLDRLQGDRSANLETAIRLFSQALKIVSRAEAPRDWALAMRNLGSAFLSRLHGNQADNLEKAIDSCRRSLKVYTRNATPEDWATSMMYLGNAYSQRVRGDRATNLETAIDSLRQAADIFSEGNRARAHAVALTNLGLAYRNRRLGNKTENISCAIGVYLQALEIYSREAMPLEAARTKMNLGAAYRNRDPKQVGDDEAAQQVYQQALEVLLPEVFPDDCRLAATGLGDLHFESRRWSQALEAYQLALTAEHHLYQASLLPGSRRIELAAGPYLHHHAAYALARLDRAKEAAAVLEQGRARVLGETVARDRIDLGRGGEADPRASQLYQDAVSKLRRLEAAERAGPKDLQHIYQQARQARATLQAAASRIEQLSDRKDLYAEPTFDEVVARIREMLPVAFIATTSSGSLILVISWKASSEAPEIDVLWADALAYQHLEALLAQRVNGDVVGGYLPGQLEHPEWLEAALDEALPCLGETLATPLLRHLHQLGAQELVLIPCGLLGLLPLHAAALSRGGYLVDEIDISYAPSGRVLSAAEESRSKLSEDFRLLVGVGNPLPSMAPLPFAELELDCIAGHFKPRDRAPLYGVDATQEALLGSLPRASYLHLACHGRFDPMQPLDTRLELAMGQSLSLREVLAQGHFRRLRLVVLSACQTAVSELHRIPDEILGLPSGFLQAGAPGVIATLWPVADLSTALIMDHFYELILHGERATGNEPLPPRRALGKAQRWLRHAEARELVERLTSKLELRPEEDAISQQIARGITRLALEEPRSRPYRSPYYWAPFILVGC